MDVLRFPDADRSGALATLFADAERRVSHTLQPTPVIPAPLDETLGAVTLKLEQCNPTGSFKHRGALNFVLAAVETPMNGQRLVTASTGNFGRALSEISRQYSLPSVVVVPDTCSARKRAALSAVGARVIVHGTTLNESLAWAETLAQDRHALFAPATHPLVVCGNATIGSELFRAAPIPDYLFMAVGTGSGIAGLVVARNIHAPQTKIVGVVPGESPAWARSVASNRMLVIPPRSALADGLAVASPSKDLWNFVTSNVERFIEVTDADITRAVEALNRITGDIIEPSGAAAYAGWRKVAGSVSATRACVIVCGGSTGSR